MYGSRKSGYTKIWSRKPGHWSKLPTQVQTVATKFWYVQIFAAHVQNIATKFWYVQTFATHVTTQLNSRVSRLKFSARLCNLSLNSKATRSSKSGHETGPQPGQLSCHAFTERHNGTVSKESSLCSNFSHSFFFRAIFKLFFA